MHLQLFKQDVQRWIVPEEVADPSQVTLIRTLLLLYRYPGLRATMWFRFGSWCGAHNIPLVGPVQRWIFFRFGLEINPGDHVEGGLYIAHVNSSVLVAEHIGRNCTIISSVTMGRRKDFSFPRIGDNVFIGAGARILGGVNVGDGAIIGANAVVIKDVPAGATVVGVPARVVRINEDKIGSLGDDSSTPQSVERVSLP